MAFSSVTTGVDDLLDYLKTHDKAALADIAKSLGLSEETVKLWVDFLVEEKIVGIEYKFTKPFIYLNKPKDEKTHVVEKERITLDTFKNDFLHRAKASNISSDQSELLWTSHVQNQVETQKDFFIREARKRQIDASEELWQEYKKRLVT